VRVLALGIAAAAAIGCGGGRAQPLSDGPETLAPDGRDAGIDASIDAAPDAAIDARAPDRPPPDGPPGLACPAPGALADGRPLEDYVIDGTRIFTGEALGWRWTVTGGPCDELFASQGKPTSMTLTGTETATLTIRPTQVGDYTVHVLIDTAGGVLDCTFVVHIAGPGLRVELCWPTSGVDDLDLHVHRPGSTAAWFHMNDDCYYLNCGGYSLSHVDWGYPGSPMTSCFDGAIGPSGAAGVCPNPRLDQDNVDQPGHPEYTNIDRPDNRATYRVMASYFGGIEPAFPMASIYCQGRLVATFGRAPDLVPGFELSSGSGDGSMWRIADITTRVDAAGVTTCEIAALHPPGQRTGYDVRAGDLTY
jgi:hypothetical protein